MDTAPYTVLQDYRTDRLNGGGPVVWSEGDVHELGADDAGWVNRDRPGTLAGPELTSEPGVPLPAAVDITPSPDAVDLPADPADGGGAGESAPAEDSQTSTAAEVPATTPAKEQVGGKPARGSSRRRDSAG